VTAADIAILVLGIGSGIGCVVFGALLLRIPPDDPIAEPHPDGSPAHPAFSSSLGSRIRAWRTRLSDPSRLAIGASAAIMGYHFAAWSTPRSWGLLCVPWEFSWLLIAGVIFAVVGSLAMDARDARESQDAAEQPPEK
jgi:hypothetical protein